MGLLGFGFCPASESVSPIDLHPLDICAGEIAQEEEHGAEAAQASSAQAQEEVVGEESAPIVKVKSPMMPTKAEIEEHESLGHVVYRNWCPVCIAARGIGQYHKPLPDEPENAVPTIVSDYCYMGQNDEKALPMLVIKDRKTKRRGATFLSLIHI